MVHPTWGHGTPRTTPVRRAIKRTAARVLSWGRSAADPRRGIAILAYHATPSDRTHPWWVDFRAQMALIADLGIQVVSLDDAVDALRSGPPPAEPTMALTFDDGWADNLEVAFPELARRGWPATVFLAAAHLGKRPYLSADEVQGLRGLGVAVGNHTESHPDLTALPPSEAQAEVERGTHRLEQLTGLRPRHFCYPFGRYDLGCRDGVARSGMVSACTGRVGHNRPGCDLFRLRRLTVEPRDGARDLRDRLAGGYGFTDLRQRRMDRSPGA